MDENKQYWPPLGVAYIAAVLRNNGHLVQILDRDLILRKDKFDFSKADKSTLDAILDFESEIVGFSATTANISDVEAFSQLIKNCENRISTVIGGPHCVGEPILTLQICKSIDMLVRGEGEMTMLDIANRVGLENILGLTYRRKDGGIISNPDRPLIESLDELPLPARDLLEMDYYTRPSRFISRNLSLRTTHIFTARGCPYNCYYCAGPLMGRRKVRYHSAQRVVTEIEELIKKYSVEAIYFAEDMFLSNKKRALELIDLFIKHDFPKKIAWMAQVSTNSVDKELLSMMKKAGCVHVEYGFESGSQRILELMNKKTDIARNINVAALTKKSGLRFQGNFIVGYPGEREDDFNQTISFIKKTKPNTVSLNIFMPLPGTEIYKQLKESGRLVTNWDDIGNPEAPFINYAQMSKSRFEELYFNAKLRVILPLNLINFLKDNIWHPIRLLYVILTQFKSVVTRAIFAFKELKKIRNIPTDKASVLFIAYHPLSYPIMDSQGIAYLKGIIDMGVNYYLLTFEKTDSVNDSKKYLESQEKEFHWNYLIYHQKPRFFAKLLDIMCGIFKTFSLIKKNKIQIIHARGLVPAAIAIIPAKLLRKKIFFDTRGLLADKYVGGGLIKEDSLLYKMMKYAENFLLRHVDYFTVETLKHAKVIEKQNQNFSSKMEIIPCCVDTKKFDYSLYQPNSQSNGKINLVYLGKFGTWYLIEEMLDFFKALYSESPGTKFTFITQDDTSAIYNLLSVKGIPEDKISIKKVTREQVPTVLSQSNAGIFFINPYERYNSFPIKYGEYLASGLPVVINSGIGDTDLITKREKIGIVVDEFSPKNYKKTAQELIELLKEGDGLRARCKEVALKYLSLESGIEKYVKIYKKLLDK